MRGGDLRFEPAQGEKQSARAVSASGMKVLGTPSRYVKASVFHGKLNRG
jgi:hypothetical protein